MFKNFQVLRFGIAGVVNTGVDWTTYFLLSRTLPNVEIAAKIAGVVMGIISAFILNSSWVFGNVFKNQLNQYHTIQAKIKFGLAKFFQMAIVYSFGMFINVLAFTILTQLAVEEIFCLLISTVCSFLLNLLLSKKYVFRYKVS